ncbi:hypothetical protein TWF481_010222 [Arthrobotrys musiformis]|uniref:Uncharacterized protein n=1 Tax=Arthrobotrys musiformis TaxID=47236 RepID=A0AAV9W1H4_9PEZI
MNNSNPQMHTQPEDWTSDPWSPSNRSFSYSTHTYYEEPPETQNDTMWMQRRANTCVEKSTGERVLDNSLKAVNWVVWGDVGGEAERKRKKREKKEERRRKKENKKNGKKEEDEEGEEEEVEEGEKDKEQRKNEEKKKKKAKKSDENKRKERDDDAVEDDWIMEILQALA